MINQLINQVVPLTWTRFSHKDLGRTDKRDIWSEVALSKNSNFRDTFSGTRGIWTYFDLFGPISTYMDLFEPIWTYFDQFGLIWT